MVQSNSARAMFFRGGLPQVTQAVRHAAKPLWAVAVAASLGLGSVSAWSQTVVKEAWVRGTVAQQKGTGMFAQITSAQGGRLVSARSPVAGVVEIHEMAMEGNVMRMRALANGLELPAGKAVELKPGGYHIMLLDLKQQLKPGDTVPLSLVVAGKDGKTETLELKVPVRPLAGNAKVDEHKGHKH
jgi:copper(I)-binding protein